MPLYTLRNKTTGEIKQTTDPGRALISGKWIHIGRFKGPILRGLAARAPYFHNGFAADLDAVIDFYNDRFNMNLTDAAAQRPGRVPARRCKPTVPRRKRAPRGVPFVVPEERRLLLDIARRAELVGADRLTARLEIELGLVRAFLDVDLGLERLAAALVPRLDAVLAGREALEREAAVGLGRRRTRGASTTIRYADIDAWRLQPRRMMPGLSTLMSRLSPFLYMPRSNDLVFDSENTLWKIGSKFGNDTVEPTGTAITCGANSLSRCSMIALLRGAASRSCRSSATS